MSDDIDAATREWWEQRPELMKQWRAEAAAMCSPYKALPSEITRYVRQQEAIWWHKKRQETKSN